MDSVFAAMVIFAFVGAVTPGPVNLIATSTAVQFGKHVAAMHVLGASIAYAIVIFVTGNTLNGLVEWLPKIKFAMQFVGSAFLCYLAYKIYTAPFSRFETGDVYHSSWANGALVQLLNPKAWLVAMSGVSLYVIGQSEQQTYLWMYTLVSLIACLVGVGLWAVVGTIFTNYLRNPSKQQSFNRAMATVLLVSVFMIWM
jgi:threonine/homoserine/homoserine lactone efflux protein